MEQQLICIVLVVPHIFAKTFVIYTIYYAVVMAQLVYALEDCSTPLFFLPINRAL